MSVKEINLLDAHVAVRTDVTGVEQPTGLTGGQSVLAQVVGAVSGTAWVTATLYYLGERVFYLGLEFICKTQHTSSVFNYDIGAWSCLTPNCGVVHQVAHGLSIGNVIHLATGVWTKAKADSASTLSNPPTIVVASDGADYFVYASGCSVTWPSHGWTLNELNYLSAATAGALVTTEPAISNPILIPIDANTVTVLTNRPQQALSTTSSPTFAGVTTNVTGNCSGSSGSCTGNAATATTATTATTAGSCSGNAATASTATYAASAGTAGTASTAGACSGNAATATKATNLSGGNATTLLGSLPYQSNTDTTSLLSPNTTATKNFLTQTGTGTNGAAPVWGTIAQADVAGLTTASTAAFAGVNISTNATGYQVGGLRMLSCRGTTGSENIFLGQSGNFTTTGVNNVYAGYHAGAADAASIENVAIGLNALAGNTYAGKNVAIGSSALTTLSYTNTTTAWDTYNIAIGYQSLYYNQPTSAANGQKNVGLGGLTLNQNTTGSYNMAIGTQTLQLNTTGDYNVGIGTIALYNSTKGSGNTAIGHSSLYELNYTGAGFAGSNTAIGYNTGRGITTGTQNTIIGANVTGLAAALDSNIILADGGGNIRLQADNTGAWTFGVSLKGTGTGGLGYGTGAGGTVTQLTSKSTAVTLNKVCGTITLHNATLNASTTVSFTVNNTCAAATDVVHIQHDSAGTLGSYTVSANTMAANSFQVTVRNITAGNLGEAIVLRFAIIKAVVA